MSHTVVPIEIEIVIPDIAAQIAAGFDRIQVHRSTSGVSGVYAEITSEDTSECPETRIPLQAGKTTYVYEDEEGSTKYYYKFRLFNTSTLATGAFSTPAPGAQDPVFDILSIEELKTNYLFGIDLTNDAGEEYPDSLYAHYIKSALSRLEHRIHITIVPTVIEEERHDFYREDYDHYIWMKLLRTPVISIEEVKLVLPGEQVVQVFSKDWIHIQRPSGQLQLLPGTGTQGSILLGAAGAFMPFIYGNNRFIPDAFRVKYTAGFGPPPEGSYGFTPGSEPESVSRPDPEYDTVPAMIKDVIGKMASFGPLNIAGDLLGGAGIASQSIGIDGLSQSFNTTSSATNAGYGARLVQYSKELKEDIPRLERYYEGIRMVVV